MLAMIPRSRLLLALAAVACSGPGSENPTDAGSGCPTGCESVLEEAVCGQILAPPAAVICPAGVDTFPLLASGCQLWASSTGSGDASYCCPVEIGNACASWGTGGTGSGGTGTGGSGPQSCAPGCSRVETDSPVGCPLDAQATWVCQAGADPSALLAGGCVQPALDASVSTGIYCCTQEFSAQCSR